MATGGQEQNKATLDQYAKDLQGAAQELETQTEYFELVRQGIEALSAYAQDNSNIPKDLPLVILKSRKRPEARGIEIDLDMIGPQAALTIKPFLEMAAGAVGAALQQSWGKVNQVNANAQQILQIANRLQHEVTEQQRQQIQPRG